MQTKVSDRQVDTLRWIADGCPGEVTNALKISARALESRRMVKIRGRGAHWSAEILERGSTYLEHGMFPDEVAAEEALREAERAARQEEADRLDREAASRHDFVAKMRAARDRVDAEVDSPAGVRRRGRRPAGDALFTREEPDLADEKILVSVKEAAWMLALTEGAIRNAVRDGDLDRVFIGEGHTHYRIVYGSLLGWVNSMPRESAVNRWYGR